MSTLKVSTISPLGTDATKTITIGDITNGDVAAGAFTNVPAFFVRLSSDQTISSGTETKVAFNTEVFDSDNAFDNSSNYRFTVPSGKAGKYIFNYTVDVFNSNDAIKNFNSYLKKNGTTFFESTWNTNDNAETIRRFSSSFSVCDDLSASDYIELFFSAGTSDSSSSSIKGTNYNTSLGGYRLIGA
jgi:hypothetical protein